MSSHGGGQCIVNMGPRRRLGSLLLVVFHCWIQTVADATVLNYVTLGAKADDTSNATTWENGTISSLVAKHSTEHGLQTLTFSQDSPPYPSSPLLPLLAYPPQQHELHVVVVVVVLGAILNRTFAILKPGDVFVVPAGDFHLVGGVTAAGWWLTSRMISVNLLLSVSHDRLQMQGFET